MPTCKNCHNKWSWKQTTKKMFTLDTGMICPYCGGRQFRTLSSRKKACILNFSVLLPLLLNTFFDIPGFVLLSLFPVLFIIIMSCNPFIMQLSNKEEYIFSSER